jgi:hypothetical protein
MLSTYSRNLLLNWLLTTGAATRPTAWYISLHTADPGKTGANELLVETDSAYVRKLAAFGTATLEVSPTTGDLTWTAAAAATAHTITHIGLWDALTAGNFLQGGALAVAEPRVASSSLVLAAGRAVASLT